MHWGTQTCNVVAHRIDFIAMKRETRFNCSLRQYIYISVASNQVIPSLALTFSYPSLYFSLSHAQTHLITTEVPCSSDMVVIATQRKWVTGLLMANCTGGHRVMFSLWFVWVCVCFHVFTISCSKWDFLWDRCMKWQVGWNSWSKSFPGLFFSCPWYEVLMYNLSLFSWY